MIDNQGKERQSKKNAYNFQHNGRQAFMNSAMLQEKQGQKEEYVDYQPLA
jgi:hypothetical protein